MVVARSSNAGLKVWKSAEADWTVARLTGLSCVQPDGSPPGVADQHASAGHFKPLQRISSGHMRCSAPVNEYRARRYAIRLFVVHPLRRTFSVKCDCLGAQAGPIAGNRNAVILNALAHSTNKDRLVTVPSRYRWFVVAVFFIFMLLHQSDQLLIGPLTTPIMNEFRINEEQMGRVFTGALIVGAVFYPL